MSHDVPQPTGTLRTRLTRLQPYFQGTAPAFALVVIGASVSAATEPLIPALLKPLLDEGFIGGSLPLWAVPLAIIGIFALRGIAGFVAQYGLAWAANRGTMALRQAMFDRLMRAHPKLFREQSASGLTSLITYEVQGGATQLVYSLLSLVKDSLTLVALLVYLLWLNWQLTLFVALLFPAVALVMRVLSKRLHRLTVAGQQATADLAYVVEENVLAWRLVRLHEAAAPQSARFSTLSDRLRRLSLKSVVAAATMTPLTQILTACALSAVIVVALWQSGQQGGTVGGFVAFVTAMLMLVAPIKHLSEVAGPITRGLAALERGLQLVAESPVEEGGTHAPRETRGAIELVDLSLRYPGSTTDAISGLNLSIRPGESVALVGPSGAGKSTLVHLLPRFIDPTAGALRLDGVDIREWDLHALRRQFALVSQDVVLFNDTIAANVSLSDSQEAPSEARVIAALQAANLMDFVSSLPQGIHSLVGHNGSQLSGGQRQRLAIARAIYKNAPILILDEATSALDSESEVLVQQALETLMKNRTSIVIAHRLSTIERADRIVAMEGGRIVEQGTHSELLALGSLYARLHGSQFRT